MAQKVKNPPAMQRPGFDPWMRKIPWRREQLPTPVFWLGEFHGLYSPWGRKESDTTERLSLFSSHMSFGILFYDKWKQMKGNFTLHSYAALSPV